MSASMQRHWKSRSQLRVHSLATAREVTMGFCNSPFRSRITSSTLAASVCMFADARQPHRGEPELARVDPGPHREWARTAALAAAVALTLHVALAANRCGVQALDHIRTGVFPSQARNLYQCGCLRVINFARWRKIPMH